MDKFSHKATWKNSESPSEDGYPGKDYDHLYLEQLNDDDMSAREKLSKHSKKASTSSFKTLGKLLIAPFRSSRRKLNAILKKNNKHIDP